jgi:uncharacterized protein YdhG (YjbR/CyaY superfamily)
MPTKSAPRPSAKKKEPAKRAPAKKAARAKKATPAKKAGAPRADYGAPVDEYFARARPAELTALLSELRTLVEAGLPGATSTIKWGLPVYELGGKMVVSIGAHKAHVNLFLWAPPATFDDPEGRLVGEGNTGRHVRLESRADLPRERVREWLRALVLATHPAAER